MREKQQPARKRTLSLSKETLRRIQDRRLAEVAGGVSGRCSGECPTELNCESVTCACPF